MSNEISKVIIEIDVEAARKASAPNAQKSSDEAFARMTLTLVSWEIARRGLCPGGKWGGEVSADGRRVAHWTVHAKGGTEG